MTHGFRTLDSDSILSHMMLCLGNCRIRPLIKILGFVLMDEK